MNLALQRLSCLLGALALAAPASAGGDLVAIRVKRAETIANGPVEHAVILVEDGAIVTIGQDLPIDRGIPVLDRSEWTVMPGLVSCWSRLGMDGEGGGGSNPEALASGELYPRADAYEELLELGVTTLGLFPAGNGIPGQAVAVRPHGDTVEEMIVRDHAYLRVQLQASSGSKKMLRDGFEKVDKFDEKERKNREKWEKAQERKKKKKKKSKKDDDEEEEEEDEGSDEYEPEVPDADVVPFMKLRSGELSALIEIRDAASYLHLLDAIDDEEFPWALRVQLRNDIDLYEVVDRIGESERRVVVEPRLTLYPGTRRELDLPRELAEAGAKVAFVPLFGSVGWHKTWRADVGALVSKGFDRDLALRAMTLEPAEVLGLGAELGSLEPGKRANLLFLDGDPLDVRTKVVAVMLEGRLVHGEVD